MDRELAELHRGAHTERARMFRDTDGRGEPGEAEVEAEQGDEGEKDTEQGGCPWGRSFCVGSPEVLTHDDPDDSDAPLGCFSCFLGLTPEDLEDGGEQ